MAETDDLHSQLKSLNIIIVDDEPVARKVLERGLYKCGYESTSHMVCLPVFWV